MRSPFILLALLIVACAGPTPEPTTSLGFSPRLEVKYSLATVGTAATAEIFLLVDGAEVATTELPVREFEDGLQVSGRAVFPVLEGQAAVLVVVRSEEGRELLRGLSEPFSMTRGRVDLGLVLRPVFETTGTLTVSGGELHLRYRLQPEVLDLVDSLGQPRFLLELSTAGAAPLLFEPVLQDGELFLEAPCQDWQLFTEGLSLKLRLQDGETILAEGGTEGLSLLPGQELVLPTLHLRPNTQELGLVLTLAPSGTLQIALEAAEVLPFLAAWQVEAILLDLISPSGERKDLPLHLDGASVVGTIDGVDPQLTSLRLRLVGAEQHTVATGVVEFEQGLPVGTLELAMVLPVTAEVAVSAVVGLSVRANNDNEPLQATVLISGDLSQTSRTDLSGNVVLELEAGHYEMLLEADGYESKTFILDLAENQVESLVFLLEPIGGTIEDCHQDMVAYWPFDRPQIVGNTVQEVMMGWTGTSTCTLTSAEGRIDQSIDLQNCSIVMGNYLNFDQTSSFSFSLWLRTDYLGFTTLLRKTAPDASKRGYLFDIGYPSYERHDYLQLHLYNNAQIREQNVWALTEYAQGAIFDDGQWHHVVVVYRGTTTGSGITFYLDGQAVDTNIIDNGPLFSTLQNNGALTIGPFRGNLDDLAIWRRALEASEINDLHSRGLEGLHACY
ncbi:MAG: hypothetical protein A2284_12760 [Deltaproteobacteria bacterium RIFOXYA12_FULL_61_11]|nr:MAG: hypothetical protein A2284_12760 [Deltaproteobacteria bacterium RIFOXYA12_FULL_61_11]